MKTKDVKFKEGEIEKLKELFNELNTDGWKAEIKVGSETYYSVDEFIEMLKSFEFPKGTWKLMFSLKGESGKSWDNCFLLYNKRTGKFYCVFHTFHIENEGE